jgi:MFS family permease
MSILPRKASQRRVLAAGFADALGTGLFVPLTVAYLNRVVGLAPTQIGLGLAIAGFAAVAGAPVSGALVDRYDARAVVLGCFSISALGFLAYTAVDSFGSFVAVAVALQLATRMERPATAALVLRVSSGQARVDSLAWQQTARNLGYGLGGLLACLALLAHGKSPFVVLLVADASSYVVAGACVWRLPRIDPVPRDAGPRAGYRAVLRDRPYARLALLQVVVALYDSLLLVAMPLWILTRTSVPVAMTALLFALNTVLVVLLQVRAARRIAARRGLSTAYRTAALAYLAACIAFAFTADESTPVAVVLLVIAVAALTRGELECTSGEWFLSAELAPLSLRGRYLGLFKLSMALQQAIGPLVVTVVLVHWGRVGWIALGVVLASAVLASRRLAAHALSRPTHADGLIAERLTSSDEMSG